MNQAVEFEQQRVNARPKHQPLAQPQRKLVKVQGNKRSTNRVNPTSLMGLVAVAGCLFIGGQLYLDSKLNDLHYDIENLKYNIGLQEVQNEELYANIAELSTYSRAMDIVESYNLETQGNIIYIGE